MNLILFSKIRKIFCRFQKCNKNFKIVFSFSDNGVGTRCHNFSQIMATIHLIGSNVLPNSNKILDLTNRNVFQHDVS